MADYQLSSRSMSSHATISSESDGPLTTDAVAIGEDELSQPGRAVSIAPPPAGEVVELTNDQEQFEQAMEACSEG